LKNVLQTLSHLTSDLKTLSQPQHCPTNPTTVLKTPQQFQYFPTDPFTIPAVLQTPS